MRRSAMRAATLSAVILACSSAAASQPSPLATAEAFIDAFYSFDRSRLDAAMADAPKSKPDILYYQGWAEGGNYVVLERKPCRFDKANEVSCGVTVKDDLMPALGFAWNVTDLFHFAFKDGRIIKVWNSSNDPPEEKLAFNWLRRERPEIFDGPCRGMFEGGPTPHDCIRAIVKGFADFTSANQRN